MDIKTTFAACLAVYILMNLHVPTITLYSHSLVSCMAIIFSILLVTEPVYTALWETLRLFLELWLWHVDIERYSRFCFIEGECAV